MKAQKKCDRFVRGPIRGHVLGPAALILRLRDGL
jgi:hypothetical protein